jgi:glutaredoxin 3
MAKDQFDKLNYPYKAIELDYRSDGAEIKKALGQLTGASTVPRVFINGIFYGGGTDMEKMYENGSLKRLLDAEL